MPHVGSKAAAAIAIVILAALAAPAAAGSAFHPFFRPQPINLVPLSHHHNRHNLPQHLVQHLAQPQQLRRCGGDVAAATPAADGARTAPATPSAAPSAATPTPPPPPPPTAAASLDSVHACAAHSDCASGAEYCRQAIGGPQCSPCVDYRQHRCEDWKDSVDGRCESCKVPTTPSITPEQLAYEQQEEQEQQAVLEAIAAPIYGKHGELRSEPSPRMESGAGRRDFLGTNKLALPRAEQPLEPPEPPHQPPPSQPRQPEPEHSRHETCGQPSHTEPTDQRSTTQQPLHQHHQDLQQPLQQQPQRQRHQLPHRPHQHPQQQFGQQQAQHLQHSPPQQAPPQQPQQQPQQPQQQRAVLARLLDELLQLR